jgi:hypothetical protein
MSGIPDNESTSAGSLPAEQPKVKPSHLDPNRSPASSEADWYFENGFMVFTAAYHLKRGTCCGSGCRHCPYEPPHLAGNKVRQTQFTQVS